MKPAIQPPGNPKNYLTQLQSREEIDKYFEDQANFYMAKREIERIDNFNGAFDFLNNEYPCQVYYEDRFYPSVFHAFLGARSSKDYERAKIALAENVQELFELAAEVKDPDNWESRRLVVMELCVRDKFRRHRDLRAKLRKTGNRELVNSYGQESESNLYWGMVDGKGMNHLGLILTNVRLDVHTDKELPRWIYMTFSPQEDKYLIPKVDVEVYKNDDLVGVEKLRGKPMHIFGSMKTCDFVLRHKSISRRHLAIVVDKTRGVLLIDLGSKSGTFINGEKIFDNYPYKLKEKDYFNVASSTRSYIVKVDYTDVEKHLQKKQKELSLDMKILKLQKDMGNDEDIVKANMGVIKYDTIFVSNLPDNCGDKMIRDAFKQFGKIVDIRIPVDRNSGRPRRIGFIKFNRENEAKAAMRAVSILIGENNVRIKFAEKNKNQIINELENKMRYGGRRSRYRRDRMERDHRRRHRRRDRRRRYSRSRSVSRSRSRTEERRRRKRRRRKRSVSPEESPSSKSVSEKKSKSKSGSPQKTEEEDKSSKSAMSSSRSVSQSSSDLSD